LLENERKNGAQAAPKASTAKDVTAASDTATAYTPRSARPTARSNTSRLALSST
jgi:hypothetical protein